MFKNILQVYALVVCAVTTIAMLIFSGLFLDTLTNLIIPEYKYYDVMGRYTSNDAYLKFRKKEAEQYLPLSGDGGDSYTHFRDKRYQDAAHELATLKALPPHQLDEQRENAKHDFLAEIKRTNIQSIIFYFQWLVVIAVFFYLHQRLYKKATSMKG
jgi:hypothetical protein